MGMSAFYSGAGSDDAESIHIDLNYQHRMDPGVPVEETVRALADLIRRA
jgi:hypothetical protein